MKFLLILTTLMMFTSFAIADDNDPPSGTTGLVCKMSRNGMTTTESLSVDYDQKLVNGIPATFSSSMIIWTVHTGSENEHHQLNRLTGIYNYWSDEKTSDGPMPTFVCDKVVAKF